MTPSTIFRTAAASAVAALLAAAPADAAPRRVAALTPFTADTLAQLGVRPVAIGQTLGGGDRLSPRLRGVPVLPLTHPFGPNLEQLAAYRPQLVLTGPAWRRGTAGMRRLRMRVTESEPRSVTALPAETRRIGALVGRAGAAARLARRQQRAIAAAGRGIRRRPKVLLVLGVGRTTYAFLPTSWGGDVVRRAGGRLITGGVRAAGGYARISDEAVVARNPDVIIAVPHGSVRDIPRMARYLRSKPGWRTTTAARRGRVFVSTGNSLLQPYTDAARTIRDVRRKFLGT